MDPHYSSGIPNLAFYTFAMAIADPQFPNRQPAYARSWQTAGRIWYNTMFLGGALPNMTMHQFASRTHAAAVLLYPSAPEIDNALSAAWTKVGV
jgi:Zn-dependent metalloprotease